MLPYLIFFFKTATTTEIAILKSRNLSYQLRAWTVDHLHFHQDIQRITNNNHNNSTTTHLTAKQDNSLRLLLMEYTLNFQWLKFTTSNPNENKMILTVNGLSTNI